MGLNGVVEFSGEDWKSLWELTGVAPSDSKMEKPREVMFCLVSQSQREREVGKRDIYAAPLSHSRVHTFCCGLPTACEGPHQLKELK